MTRDRWAATQGIFVVIWLWLALIGAARAQSTPLRALVLLAEPEDTALLERVRGQTNDLPVELALTEAEPAQGADLASQLRRAAGLAQQRGAQVVIWFAREQGALSVLVADPPGGRILVRRLEHAEGELDTSARYEAAALVVRTALRALAQGGEIGVAEPELRAVPPPPPVPPEPKVIAPPPAPPPSDSWAVLLGVGERAVWDGVSRYGQHAASARVIIQRGRAQLELQGQLGIAAAMDTALARVQLARHGLGLLVGWAPHVSERFRLSTALGAGMLVFASQVQARGAQLQAQDTRLVVMAANAEVALRFMPAWAAGRAGLTGRFGAEVMPRAPRLGYQDTEGTFVRRERLWNVAPMLGLELNLRLD